MASEPVRLPLPVSVLVVTGSVISKVAGGLLDVVRSSEGLRLTVGDFTHTLSTETPVLRTSATSYVLPGSSDNSKQVVLSFGRDCAAAALEQFDKLLSSVAQVRRGLSDTRADAAQSKAAVSSSATAAPLAPEAGASGVAAESAAASPTAAAASEASTAATLGTYVATGVVFAGKAVSQGLVVGAEYSGAGLRWCVPASKGAVSRLSCNLPCCPPSTGLIHRVLPLCLASLLVFIYCRAAEKIKPYVATPSSASGSSSSDAALSSADAALAPSPTGRPPQLAVAADAAASASSTASARTVRVSGIGAASVSAGAATATGAAAAPVKEWGGAAGAPADAAASAAATPGLDKWKTVLTVAKWASSAAVTGSRAVAAGVTAAAGTLGTSLASAISTTDYGRSWKESEQTDTGRAVRQVAAASLVAYRDVMDGLERAAEVFAAQAGPATTDLVKARYGEEAAAVAQQGLSVAADVGTAAWNIRNVGVRGLVRATATEAGKELVVGKGAAAVAASAPAVAAPAGSAISASVSPAAVPLAKSVAAPQPSRGGSTAASAAVPSTASGTAATGDASLEALLASMPAPPTAAPASAARAARASGTAAGAAPSR